MKKLFALFFLFVVPSGVLAVGSISVNVWVRYCSRVLVAILVISISIKTGLSLLGDEIKKRRKVDADED